MPSNKDKNLIATIKSWNIQNAGWLRHNHPEYNIEIVTRRKELIIAQELKPRYIFFPHWSWRIPKEICENFECVVFHATDLPYGRGGSPIQNLIVRGLTKTKISALKANGEIDGGPVYLKCDLKLDGTVEDILQRASETIFRDMIPRIITNEFKPTPQKGEPTTFSRRTPEQSDISLKDDPKKIYDYIRMLDGEGYPSAYIKTSELKVEFTKARYENECVIAQATIKAGQ